MCLSIQRRTLYLLLVLTTARALGNASGIRAVTWDSNVVVSTSLIDFKYSAVHSSA